MTEVTWTLIDDPATIGLTGIEPTPTVRFISVGGGRRVRRLHQTGEWLWQTATGAEGTVPTRDEAFTMLALHCPDLRHLVTGEPAA